jgi:peptidoglycan hydrolase-like amidase
MTLSRGPTRFELARREIPERPRSWRKPLVACLLGLAAVALVLPACARRGADAQAAGPAAADGTVRESIDLDPSGAGAIPAPEAPQPAAPAPKPLPALDHEPRIGVLLQDADAVAFTLLVPARCGGFDLTTGEHRARVAGGQIVLDGAAFGPAAEFTCADAPGARFAAALVPPGGGKAQPLRFAGDPALVLRGDHIELIERVGLETYLAGVVPTEMRRDWPAAALQAQAIAARSYACSHWLERADQPWQLHWHYSIDMAYGGFVDKAPAAAAAVAATRGRIVRYQGLPLPALFSASSGGRTESCANAFPALRAADGRLVVAPAMPAVDDAADAAGCAGLKMTATHGHWHARIPLADVTAGLTAWAAAHPAAHLVMGEAIDVTPGRAYPDSGRLATVVVRHRRGAHEYLTEMPATEFRMAIGPGRIRSTWWETCAVDDGTLAIDGRGFGHGVGLSQVSAWELAQEGFGAEAIVARFYPGAELTTAY